MAQKILIEIEGETLEATLNDTPPAKLVSQALPIESTIKTWGDEFYFSAGLQISADETITTDVEVGDLGYWPEGDCLCIFFGPTPMSSSDKPVPASGVFLIGKLLSDPKRCKALKRARKIRWLKKNE